MLEFQNPLEVMEENKSFKYQYTCGMILGDDIRWDIVRNKKTLSKVLLIIVSSVLLEGVGRRVYVSDFVIHKKHIAHIPNS